MLRLARTNPVGEHLHGVRPFTSLFYTVGEHQRIVRAIQAGSDASWGRNVSACQHLGEVYPSLCARYIYS